MEIGTAPWMESSRGVQSGCCSDATPKLEHLGLLAGGIAHDFSNLLSVVLGNAQYIQRLLSPSREALPLDDTLESVAHIEQATRAAGRLVEQLFILTGRGGEQRQQVDMAALCHEIAPLLRSAFPATLSMHITCDPAVPPIVGDYAQLTQVLMNLLTNAADAIGEQPGTIKLSTAQASLDRAALDSMVLGADCAPGDYVALVVADTGCGMDAETLARVFEPFFTTKADGRGLGLASLLGIVRAHAGALAVESAPRQGTTFWVWFPTMTECADSVTPHAVSMVDALERGQELYESQHAITGSDA